MLSINEFKRESLIAFVDSSKNHFRIIERAALIWLGYSQMNQFWLFHYKSENAVVSLFGFKLQTVILVFFLKFTNGCRFKHIVVIFKTHEKDSVLFSSSTYLIFDVFRPKMREFSPVSLPLWILWSSEFQKLFFLSHLCINFKTLDHTISMSLKYFGLFSIWADSFLKLLTKRTANDVFGNISKLNLFP